MVERKNILIVAPSFIPTSKDSVAGIEQMVYTLGRALHEHGYDVTTIAREDSQVFGKLISGGFVDVNPFKKAELEHFHQVMSYTASQVRKAIRREDFDVIIDRCQGVSLITSIEENGPPVICGLDMESKYFLHPKIFETLRVSIAERKDYFAACANHVAEEYKQKLGINPERMHVVHNGIITDNYLFSDKHEGYLLYLGRITEGKAPHLAISIATTTRHKLIVAGGNIPGSEDGQYADKEYFEKRIRESIGKNVEFFGPANLGQKVKLMQGAKALIFPSRHREAFPLVTLEAMCCGVPVIAYPKSSGMEDTGVSEQVIDGENGYLIDYFYEPNLKFKLDTIDTRINRRTCSDHVRQNFDYKIMGEGYQELIERITG